MLRRRFSAALGASVLSTFAAACRRSGAAAPGTGAPLAGPYRIEARRALFAVRGAERPRPRFGAPVRDLEGVSYYVDDAKSVADPELKARNERALAPVRRFASDVAALADSWATSDPPDWEAAVLAVDALSTWAAARALLGKTNSQGDYERKWTLGALALAYLKVRDAPGVEPRRRALVEAWLRELALAIAPRYEELDRTSSKNNHAYWAGLAVSAAGVAAQDRLLFAWGLSRARLGVAAIDASGILPLELARKSLALHYHVFALTPLVVIAELAEANGVALHGEGGGAIRRLADRVIRGLEDPSEFERLTRTPQRFEVPPSGSALCWAEPYYARFRDERVRGWLRRARPLGDRRLGGDVSAAFGAASL